MTDNTEFYKMLRRMIKAGAKRAGQADEHDLADFADLQNHLSEMIRKAVHDQRDCGKSWTDIAAALNITRQAACKRFK
jgi:hypothetical protein